jgi:hypothetical protein
VLFHHKSASIPLDRLAVDLMSKYRYWLRRFGPKTSLPPQWQEDDEEAIALLLCAIAAESLSLQ